MTTLASLHAQLTADAQRKDMPFAADLRRVQDRVLLAELSDLERFELLRPWLESDQPCLFGRLAAKHDRLSFCILTLDDLKAGDRFVRDKIQNARLQWWRDAYRGTKSGFIIAVLSPTLAAARPDARLRDFALKVTSLYLRKEVEADSVVHDSIWLKEDDDFGLMWRVGVNFFAAAGDGRWWNDHRFPGGVALSMNSVGHMAKSSGLQETRGGRRVPDSLAGALRLAMQTISKASSTCSGPATELKPRTAHDGCPHTDERWPAELKGKDRKTYAGWYHTDYTIPAAYFRSDVGRPTTIRKPFDLDFSYLWDDSIENPDHLTMGLGERVPR